MREPEESVRRQRRAGEVRAQDADWCIQRLHDLQPFRDAVRADDDRRDRIFDCGKRSLGLPSGVSRFGARRQTVATGYRAECFDRSVRLERLAELSTRANRRSPTGLDGRRHTFAPATTRAASGGDVQAFDEIGIASETAPHRGGNRVPARPLTGSIAVNSKGRIAAAPADIDDDEVLTPSVAASAARPCLRARGRAA